MGNNKYTEWIQFRVSPEEKGSIKEKAVTKNLSLSSYLRFRALEEEEETNGLSQEPLLWMVETLASIGNQLNHFQSIIDSGQHPESVNLRILIRSMEKFLRGVQPHDR